jgi:carboxypeptidase C (cathepsin A)
MRPFSPVSLVPAFVAVVLGAGFRLAERSFVIAATAASAPATTRPAATQPEKAGEATQAVVEKASITEGQVTVRGEVLKYHATAAKLLMKDENGKLKATVFFVAYDKDRPADASAAGRPITFVFNGGPGAAAVWLHLGAAGPWRVDLKENGEPLPPPYKLVENAYSWLDATDLVFIDPVGTGFSRAAEGQNPEQFYGVKEDISWVGDFIRLYITQYQRWPSPQFLAGESYGTTRAAGLSEYLLDRYGIALNGIVLISSVLDFQTLEPGGANDLPYTLYLPSYAAVAWYHKKLPADLQSDLDKTLKEVQDWTGNTYSLALARGGAITTVERRVIVDRLARYTALPADFIDKCNLRIPLGVFQKHLLWEERKVTGRFDGRITGYDPNPIASRPSYDPSLSQYLAIYSSTFNDYVRRVLKYDSTLPYEVLSNKVHPWKFGEAGHGYLSVADDLASAMVKNPHLKVLFASGYFDLATPYFSANYTIDHLDISPEMRANITHTFYMGGHMMYHNLQALEKLHADLAGFIRAAVPAAP